MTLTIPKRISVDSQSSRRHLGRTVPTTTSCCCFPRLTNSFGKSFARQILTPQHSLELEDGLDIGKTRRGYFEFLASSQTHRCIDEHYDHGPEVARGNFGSVAKRFHHQTKTYRAVKHIQWPSLLTSHTEKVETQKVVRHELQVLLSLDHPYVVLFREWFEDPWGGFYFVMEWCEHGTLTAWIQKNVCGRKSQSDRLSAHSQLRGFAKHICEAVSYIHNLHILHRDIKPENVLLTGKLSHLVPKLIDFGLTVLEGSRLRSTEVGQGTLEFMAPELFAGDAVDYTAACDVWSLGIMFANMISAMYHGLMLHPFIENSVRRGGPTLVRHYLRTAYINRVEWDRSLFEAVPEELMLLLESILRYENRISDKELLENPWIAREVDICCEPIGNELLNFKSFSKLSKLHRSVLGVVAANVPQDDEVIQGLISQFTHLDKDNTGRLSRSDISRAFSAAGLPITEPELEEAFPLRSSGHDGDIDYSTWLAATIDKQYLKEPLVADAAFNAMDIDDSGTIKLSSLRTSDDGDESCEEMDSVDMDKAAFRKLCETIGMKRFSHGPAQFEAWTDLQKDSMQQDVDVAALQETIDAVKISPPVEKRRGCCSYLGC